MSSEPYIRKITPFEEAIVRAQDFGASMDAYVQWKAYLDTLEEATPQEKIFLEAVFIAQESARIDDN